MTTATTVDREHNPLHWSEKVIVLCGGVAVTLAVTAVVPILPRIEAALAVGAQDKFLIKQMIGIVGLATIVGSPLAGVLADRLGLKRILLGFCLLYALAGTAGLYLARLDLLLVSRFFLGVGASAITTLCIALVNKRLVANQRAKWIGLHVSVSMVAAIVILPLAGYLGEYGWRLPFALYGLGLALALVALFTGGTKPVTDKAATDVATDDTRFLEWFPFRYAIAGFLIGTVYYLPIVYVPFQAADIGVTSPTVIGMVMTVNSIIGAILAALYGQALRLLSIHQVFLSSFAVAGIGLAMVAFTSNLVLLVAGMIVYGFGSAWLFANLMTALGERVPAHRQGRAVGLVRAAITLASPLSIVAVEPLANRLGPSAALLAGAGVAFALLLLVGAGMLKAHGKPR